MTSSPDQIAIELVSPSTEQAQEAVRSYTDDVASRYYGRQATEGEIDTAIRQDPSDDLVVPHGLFLLARDGQTVLGCVGLRILPGGIGEVKRLYVVPEARRSGLGFRLMTELEWHAREHVLSTLRLDTRSDLFEARRLYKRLGYEAAPAFNNGPYADLWFEKTLA